MKIALTKIQNFTIRQWKIITLIHVDEENVVHYCET
jgi:hypothetical protein